MINFACKDFDLDKVIKCSLTLTKSEYNILKLLMNSENNLSSEEVSEKISIDLSTAQRSLKKLREKKLIERNQINLSPGGYVFLYKAKNKSEIKNKISESINLWTKKLDFELSNW